MIKTLKTLLLGLSVLGIAFTVHEGRYILALTFLCLCLEYLIALYSFCSNNSGTGE